MNFQDLLAKMAELDQPATEAVVVPDAPVEECGEPMGMTPPMGDAHKDTPPPSMSVNLNAQGLDDIAELMKLMTKVNPDMINQPEKPAMPSLSISSPGMPGMGDRQELPPLKMLPDLDKDEPSEKGPEDKEESSDNDEDDIMTHLNKELKPFDDQQAKDKEEEKEEATDRRDAYQRDFDASQTGFGKPEREDDEGEDEQDEAFGNAPEGEEPSVASVDYMNNQLAGGMNRPKTMHKHSYKQGDNPMAMEGNDLRASIRAELLQRLAEAKGAK